MATRVPAALASVVFLALSLGWSGPIAAEGSAAPPPSRVPMRGTTFPDGVIALTWDDGPDAHTLALARYLHAQHVSGSFFMVGSWVEGISEEPGVGANKLVTGYEHIAIQDQVAALGHRVEAHTRHHVLLGRATAEVVRAELANAPFREDQVRLFRAPGGWWTDDAKSAFNQPAFADLVGPIHWDIDAKDWECSLYCRSTSPDKECEPGPIPKEPRVRADVIAARYLAQIESAKHGIVLLHDRVGDVGSSYALDIARKLVPELVARRYVFAPPILRFAELRERVSARLPSSTAGVHRGDLNGDGTLDECNATTRGVECALHDGVAFKSASVWSDERLPDFTLADVNGDGRADLCAGKRCGLAP